MVTLLFPSQSAASPGGAPAVGELSLLLFVGALVLQSKPVLTTSVVPGTLQCRFCPRDLCDLFFLILLLDLTVFWKALTLR